MMTEEKAKQVVQAMKRICALAAMVEVDELLGEISLEETLLPFFNSPMDFSSKADAINALKIAAKALKKFKGEMGLFAALAIQQGFHLEEKERQIIGRNIIMDDVLKVASVTVPDPEWWKWFVEACKNELGFNVDEVDVVNVIKPGKDIMAEFISGSSVEFKIRKQVPNDHI